jgi:hypothetical protein
MKILFATAAFLAVALSTADAGYVCRLGGHWYSGRCPDYISANGRWYRHRFVCLRTGRYGHC